MNFYKLGEDQNLNFYSLSFGLFFLAEVPIILYFCTTSTGLTGFDSG